MFLCRQLAVLRNAARSSTSVVVVASAATCIGAAATFATSTPTACSASSGSQQQAHAQVAQGTAQKVLVMGGPGAGKGTQCVRLAERFKVPHISTGALFRAEVAAGTPRGKQLAAGMANGGLVSNELAMDVLFARLQQPECMQRGWLGDGWAREQENTYALLESPQGCGRPHLVLVLTVPRPVLLRRLTGRRVDPATGATYHLDYNMPEDPTVRARLSTRKDDTPEAVTNRLDLYDKGSMTVLLPFRGAGIAVVEVNGEGSIEEVTQRLVAAWERHFGL